MMSLQQIIQTGGMSSADQSELLAYMKANPDFAAEAAGIASKYSGLIEAEAKKAAEAAKKAEAPTTKQVKTINPVSLDHSANARMLENDEFAKAIAAIEAGPITIPEFKPQRVYHGSAVRNLEKIGFELPKADTGVQVFGTGIYFSQSKEVAEEFYRRGKELGDLYEADIPHDNYLLDYDKPFTQQSDYVKNALRSHPDFKTYIDAQLGEGKDIAGLRFQEMADISTTKFMSDATAKAARSELLNSLGIKGNRHLYLVKDGAGKEIIADAFAIYDPKNITNVRGTKEAPTAEKIAQHALDSKPKAQVDEWSDFLGENVSDLFAPKKPLGTSQVKPVNPISEAHSANERMPATRMYTRVPNTGVDISGYSLAEVRGAVRPHNKLGSGGNRSAYRLGTNLVVLDKPSRFTVEELASQHKLFASGANIAPVIFQNKSLEVQQLAAGREIHKGISWRDPSDASRQKWLTEAGILADAPTEHYEKFIKDVHALNMHGLDIDPSKSANFFYDSAKGFTIIDMIPKRDGAAALDSAGLGGILTALVDPASTGHLNENGELAKGLGLNAKISKKFFEASLRSGFDAGTVNSVVKDTYQSGYYKENVDPHAAEPHGPPKPTFHQKLARDEEVAKAAQQKVEPTPKKISKATAAATPTPVSQSAPQVKPATVKPVVTPTQTPADNPIPKQHSANKPMGQAARPNVTPPPVRSANNPNPNSWTSILQDTTIHALDIETTSTQAGKARIYNIGVSQFRNRQTISSTDHFIGGLVKPHLKESVEDQLLKLHTTPNARRFGKEQKARGVFKRYAEASQYTTVDAAFSDFSNQLASTNGKRFILGQNLNFENGMFKSALGANGEQALSQEAVEAYNIAAGRTGLHKSTTDLFKEYKVIENLKDKNNPEGTQGFFNTFKKMLETRQQHTADEMHEALGNYAGAYDRVVDAYKDLIEAGAKSGNAPVVDLLDITRATYARAAMAGDMEPEFIGHGSSIEFLLQGLFGEHRKESHLGTADNADAVDIFHELAEEHDKYRADPTYRSTKLAKLNQRFKDTDELHVSFVRGISNRLEERASQSKDVKGFLVKAQSALDDGLHYSSHLDIGRTSRINIHSAVSKAIDEIPERFNTTEKANKYLEEVLQSASAANKETARAAETATKSSVQTLKTKLLNKKLLIGAGALVAANMLFTGDKRSTEDYNTYDELYNNQYYGTQFADWQARNKHHKMIY